jgi:hypothetical protein
VAQGVSLEFKSLYYKKKKKEKKKVQTSAAFPPYPNTSFSTSTFIHTWILGNTLSVLPPLPPKFSTQQPERVCCFLINMDAFFFSGSLGV